jgi:cyclomaltodextrinase / maltogenic alpha-amylase / neopullulanase
MTISTPEWVRHAVFYQIFPDRFAFSKNPALVKPTNLEPWDSKPTQHGFKGGDLYGVIEKLDYLRDLGFNAIYFNPLFQSAANHRYHTHDFYRIDPILGGDAAFDALINAAHKKKIKIVIDGVFNHASRGFYQFNHALENGAASPYLDWFHISGFPVHAYDGTPRYAAWWDIPALPKFNTKTQAVRDFIWDVGEYWIKRGIDGWRLDVPAEIDDDAFWREFRRRVKTANPDAYIVGEIWHEAQRWLQGDQFDAVMNYLFTRAAIGFFTGGKWDTHLVDGAGHGAVSKLDASGFAYTLNHMLGIYSKAITDVQLNLLDSHDTARFLSIARNDPDALKLALACMLTLPGAPCVYYGTEIGLAGGKDPDCRRAFPADAAVWNMDLHAHTRALIQLRHKHRALRDGQFRVLFAEGMCVAYLREHAGEQLLVALNAGAEPVDISVHSSELVPGGARFKGVFGSRAQSAVRDGVFAPIHVPARGCVALARHN